MPESSRGPLPHPLACLHHAGPLARLLEGCGESALSSSECNVELAVPCDGAAECFQGAGGLDADTGPGSSSACVCCSP